MAWEIGACELELGVELGAAEELLGLDGCEEEGVELLDPSLDLLLLLQPIRPPTIKPNAATEMNSFFFIFLSFLLFIMLGQHILERRFHGYVLISIFQYRS